MNPLDQTGVSVHAGFPNPAADTTLDGLSLDRLLIKHPASTFLWRIKGSGGEERGIFDGDIAVVDRALEPRAADLVVWWQDDGFALSKFSRLPENTTAWGMVVAVIHQYR